MNFQQMYEAINRRVDDVVENEDALEWLNEAQKVMGIAVGAKFPDLTIDIGSTFVFDERYHHIPVLYACARYKEQDSAINEAMNFHQQFEEQKREFVENYEIPPRYREDRMTQQFIADEGQTVFTITKPGYPTNSYGDLIVYVNDVPVTFSLYSVSSRSFTLLKPCNEGDHVTAIWEEHFDMVEPPYPWWGAW